jgi:methionyl aminopeptidase
MSISTSEELNGMQQAGHAVASVLKAMCAYAQPGISAHTLDLYGGELLSRLGAISAPKATYGFPGYTCISLNQEVAHGIPSAKKILKEGDLVNIDVSAALNGFWADNGASFVLGNDLHQHQKLVNTSKAILAKALGKIRHGIKIADIGRLIETEAKRNGYRVIRNLVGHGIGKSLHEEPTEIPCFYDRNNKHCFKKGMTVAIETFISTKATHAYEHTDGWTLVTRDGSFVAQHEHTIMVTEAKPVILTAGNGIWD